VTAEGRVVPNDYSVLAFLTGGEISQIAVSEGQQVEKGALLASLGKREALQAALSAGKLAQTSAQQDLNELKRNAELGRSQAEQTLADAHKLLPAAKKAYDDVFTTDFNKKIDDKEIALQAAKDKLKDAQDALDKYIKLEKDNQTRKDAQKTFDTAQIDTNKAVSERDLLKNQQDQAQAGLALANAHIADAQYALDQRKSGPTPDALALAQARLDAANDQAAAAQRALDNLDLKAPYGGTVMEIKNVAVGSMVTANQPLLVLADTAQWLVETKDLTELDVVKLSETQKVSLIPDAIPDLRLLGTVKSISRTYTEKSGDILYTVRVQLTNSDPRLRWGMTVKVNFLK
jgi:multidrug efflux pump subunit AcrA (membrane-fusion protein)